MRRFSQAARRLTPVCNLSMDEWTLSRCDNALRMIVDVQANGTSDAVVEARRVCTDVSYALLELLLRGGNPDAHCIARVASSIVTLTGTMLGTACLRGDVSTAR